MKTNVFLNPKINLALIILYPLLLIWQGLVGLFLALIFAKLFFFLYYNSLTSLFFVASAFFLIKGLKSTKHWWIMISSFVLGLNIFGSRSWKRNTKAIRKFSFRYGKQQYLRCQIWIG